MLFGRLVQLGMLDLRMARRFDVANFGHRSDLWVNEPDIRMPAFSGRRTSRSTSGDAVREVVQIGLQRLVRGVYMR